MRSCIDCNEARAAVLEGFQLDELTLVELADVLLNLLNFAELPFVRLRLEPNILLNFDMLLTFEKEEMDCPNKSSSPF